MIKYLTFALLAISAPSYARVRRSETETDDSTEATSATLLSTEVDIVDGASSSLTLTEEQVPVCEEYCTALNSQSGNISDTDSLLSDAGTGADSDATSDSEAAPTADATPDISSRSVESDSEADTADNSDAPFLSDAETVDAALTNEIDFDFAKFDQVGIADRATCEATCPQVGAEPTGDLSLDTSEAGGTAGVDGSSDSTGSGSRPYTKNWEKYGAFMTIAMIPYFLH